MRGRGEEASVTSFVSIFSRHPFQSESSAAPLTHLFSCCDWYGSLCLSFIHPSFVHKKRGKIPCHVKFFQMILTFTDELFIWHYTRVVPPYQNEINELTPMNTPSLDHRKLDDDDPTVGFIILEITLFLYISLQQSVSSLSFDCIYINVNMTPYVFPVSSFVIYSSHCRYSYFCSSSSSQILGTFFLYGTRTTTTDVST